MNLLLSFILAGWFWTGPKMNVDACPGWTLQQSMYEADVVFTGPVLDVTFIDKDPDEHGQQRIIVTFNNNRYWKWKEKKKEKREVSEKVSLYTMTSHKPSLEGFTPVIGEEYVIFARYRVSDWWWMHSKDAKKRGLKMSKWTLFYDRCLPSGPVSTKKVLIQELGPGKDLNATHI